MGAGHFLRERKGGVVPPGDDGEPVFEDHVVGGRAPQHPAHHQGHLSFGLAGREGERTQCCQLIIQQILLHSLHPSIHPSISSSILAYMGVIGSLGCQTLVAGKGDGKMVLKGKESYGESGGVMVTV